MAPQPLAGTPVLHFPDWRSGNPYQALLADALAREGVEVVFATYAGALFPLWRNIRKHRASILHLHWVADCLGANEANPIKYVLKQLLFRLDVVVSHRLLRGRIIWTVHNLAAHESRHPKGDRAARRFLARRAAYLLVHSHDSCATVARAYAKPEPRIIVVPLGNFMGVYPNATARAQSRRRLGVPEDRFIFLFLGSIRPYKGLEDLLDSFKRVPDSRKFLILAGRAPDPRYREIVRKRAALENVLLVDRFIACDELQFFFSASDAVVLPFKEVLTSASLLLAMGFGRMIIAPRLGCIPEYADPAGCILYDPGTANALKTALTEAFARDVEFCGRSNMRRAQRFGWEEAAVRTAEIYGKLLSGE